ncbi:MAG: cyclic nucleotide-binding domain-containing protein [Parachlamydiaceae bacterium]
MADIIIIIAELLIISSYLFVNVVILRVFAALGMAAYVVAGFTAGYENEGMKALIFFSSVAVIVNLVQIYRLVKERLTVFLPVEVQEIYTRSFSFMNEVDFMKIYKIAKKRNFEFEETVISQDVEINTLLLIVRGKAGAQLDGAFISTLSIGEFIGDMSYISGDNTSTSVIAISKSLECLEWSWENLENLKKRDPGTYNHFFRAVSRGIVSKLAESNYLQHT